MQVSYDSKALKQEHALGFEHLYTLIVTCEFFFFQPIFMGAVLYMHFSSYLEHYQVNLNVRHPKIHCTNNQLLSVSRNLSNIN